MKTESELFEAWAYSKKCNIFRVRDMGIDRYVDDFVDGAWNGWQASTQREGFVLVPVEPTLKMSVAYEKNSIAPVSSLSVAGYKAMIKVIDNDH